MTTGRPVSVQRFVDEYETVAVLHDMAGDELRNRDNRQGRPPRWLAVVDGKPVGAVTAWRRPDDRTFLSFAGGRPDTYGPLASVVARDLTRSLYVWIDTDEVEDATALRAAGFVTELEMEKFRVGFGAVLARLKRAWIPSGFAVHAADEVDEDRLFELDNTLRQDVPGTDGWRGDRAAFSEELAETPPFDPSAYLVGVDGRTGEYGGLVRIWRNPSGPRLGLVGVLRPYRTTSLASALLQQALAAASEWGHKAFVTETSLSNRAIHPRLRQLGAESLGRFLQLVRAPD